MLFQKIVKIGELLRNRNSREIWLVVSKSTQGMFVINLMRADRNPADVHMILPAHNEMWDRDTEIEDLERWEKELIEAKMPLIEKFEQMGHNKIHD